MLHLRLAAYALLLGGCRVAPPASPVVAIADDSVTPTGLHLHRSADSVRLVTSDVSRFWRAYDDAANKDSATRVRIFRDEYFAPASIGLRDFTRIKLVRNHGDSTNSTDSALADAAAVQFAGVTKAWPRYYNSIRGTTLAVDTSSVVSTTVREGLRRLMVLYPSARFPDVYFVMGRVATGGTASPHGLLMGVEIFSRAPATPVDELPSAERLAATIAPSGLLGQLVLHEAVHFLQPDGEDPDRPTVLKLALIEGGANFLAELATHPFVSGLGYQRFGDEHEAILWPRFRQDMHGSDLHRWISNYTQSDNLGAPDLGYWAGYKIAAAYYAHASDKRAAVRDLILLRDPERIWRESGYDRAP